MTEEKTSAEDNAAKVQALEGQVAGLQRDIEKARNEAARHRVARNQALRRNHAYGQVLKAHKITFDVDTADLGSLSIEDGKVAGEFSYEPPSTTQADPPKDPPGKSANALTYEDIQAMSYDEIKEHMNTDEFKAVMQSRQVPLTQTR